MHVISRRKLKEFWVNNKESETVLNNWFRIMKTFRPQNFAELHTMFPGADLVGSCTIFNVSGNKYRLITRINFRIQRIYILYVLTHKEYDLDKWKKDCDC
ncbi:MAG: type II toxin-antitoxin system HigB family toxin [Acidobacteria bacterium]|jgi:mRNA interferase HigB|nr:type II toxin-antitoxin system HigB family toxin [Acidobacteriota bacterium]